MKRNRMIDFLCIFSLLSFAQGWTTISKSIEHDTKSCYVKFIDELNTDSIVLYSMDGISFPSCPNEIKTSLQQNAFLACVSDSIPTVTLISDSQNIYVARDSTTPQKNENYFYPSPTFFDTTLGFSDVFMIWNGGVESSCWTDTQKTTSSYFLDVCYWYPDIKAKMCKYQNFYISVNGDVYAYGLLSSENIYLFDLYAPNVISSTDLKFNFNSI